jgi:hypothetical protein
VTTERHPSYLELDRRALGVAIDPASEAHVTRCERCQGYLAATSAAPVAPTWLEPRLRARRRRRIAGFGAVAGALALAASVCLMWFMLPGRGANYDGIKGAPSVGVYVQRGAVVQLWNGSALQAGDRIRLEVAPEEFSYVSVFSVPPVSPLVRLYAGPVKRGARNLLPKAWQVDAADGPEQLAVFLSDMEISAPAAQTLLRARDPEQVWLVRLSLPKQSGPRR